MASYQSELARLDQEIRQSAADAERKMLLRRMELMEPVRAMLESTIRQVAEADGYTFVLNATDATGTSIIMHAPEDRDLTSRILEELGVSFPETVAESAPETSDSTP